MELIPEDNNSPNTPEKNYITDDKSIEDRVIQFKQILEKECQEYGHKRGIRKATQLYKENINLEKEIKEYKNKIEHLRMLLESKTPKTIRGGNLYEISTPDILTPDILTPK